MYLEKTPICREKVWFVNLLVILLNSRMNKISSVLLLVLLITLGSYSLFHEGYLRIEGDTLLVRYNTKDFSINELAKETGSDEARIILPVLTILAILLLHRKFERYRRRCRHWGSRDTSEVNRESYRHGGTIYLRCNTCFQDYEIVTLASPDSRR